MKNHTFKTGLSRDSTLPHCQKCIDMLYKSPELGLSENDGSSTCIIQNSKQPFGKYTPCCRPRSHEVLCIFHYNSHCITRSVDSITIFLGLFYYICRCHVTYYLQILRTILLYNLSVIHRFNHQFTFYDCRDCRRFFRYIFSHVISCHVIDIPR